MVFVLGNFIDSLDCAIIYVMYIYILIHLYRMLSMDDVDARQNFIATAIAPTLLLYTAAVCEI